MGGCGALPATPLVPNKRAGGNLPAARHSASSAHSLEAVISQRTRAQEFYLQLKRLLVITRADRKKVVSGSLGSASDLKIQ